MLPPPSVFGEEQNLPPTLNWRRLFGVVKSAEFVGIVIGTLFITLVIGLTVLVSYGFFSFMVAAISAAVCFLIFSTFVFSQSSYLDGFFMIVGNGYLYVAILTLLSRSLSLRLVPISDELDAGGVASQIETLTRLIEVISFAVGLGLAHRSFKGGWKLVVIICSSFLVFCTLVLCSVFWWKIFPTVVNRAVDSQGNNIYKATIFRSVTASLWPFYFWALMGVLVWRRRHFTETVFVFLFVSLSLRSINLVLNAFLRELAQNPLDVAQLLTRLASFLFLYFSVGTSVLRDPMKNLFYALNLKQAALANQTSVISWMIDQVPSVCILLDDSCVVQHINKYGIQKLKCSPRAPLINDNFFNFLTFESDTKRNNVIQQAKDLVRERCPNNYVVFTSQSTQVESNRVIEWTLKLVKSSMPISVSSSSSQVSSSDAEQRTATSKSASSDSTLSILCLGRDMTDEIEREELLLEARNNAEKLALMQENFVANTSHELRTPLNCIVGVSDLLLMQNNNESDGEMVTMIKTSANSLLALINDLLEFAKLKQGQTKLTYGPMRLRSFVENVVMSMSVLYEKGGIDFCYSIARECPDYFENDENRLRQILFNLLSNAVKFTQKGQILLNVSISSMSLSRASSVPFLKITVSDSGIGISKEDMKNLFTRFFQVDKHRTQKGAGTGIGLSISKQLVELMGGTISVDSVVGSGTTFTIKIPLEQTRQGPKVDSFPTKRSATDYMIAPDSNITYSSPDHRVIIFLKNSVVGQAMSIIMANEYEFKCTHYSSATEVENALNHYLNILEGGSNRSQCNTDEEDEEEDPRHKEIKRISILLELKHLKELNISILNRLKEKGVEIQIVMALAHSASCQTEMESPLYRDFQLNLVRKPFNTTKIASTLRIRNIGEKPITRPQSTEMFVPFREVAPNEFEMGFIDTSKAFTSTQKIKKALRKHSNDASPDSSRANSFENSLDEQNVIPLDIVVEEPKDKEATTPDSNISSMPQFNFSSTSVSFSPVPSFGTHNKKGEKSDFELVELPKSEETPQTIEKPITIVPHDPEETKAEENKSSLKILIVEDDKTNQKVLQLMLKRIPSIEYDIAEDGQQGVEAFLKMRSLGQIYDCIFMDSQMPVMDGAHATAEIRRVESEDTAGSLDRTYVTALTANALMDEKSQLFRTLVDDYLTKPITFKTFSDKIEWIRKQKSSK